MVYARVQGQSGLHSETWSLKICFQARQGWYIPLIPAPGRQADGSLKFERSLLNKFQDSQGYKGRKDGVQMRKVTSCRSLAYKNIQEVFQRANDISGVHL